MSQKGLQNFDKLIQQKFDNHELAVPEDLWSKIESQRTISKKSNKKRYAILFLLFGFLSISSLYYLSSTSAKKIADTTLSAKKLDHRGEKSAQNSYETNLNQTSELARTKEASKDGKADFDKVTDKKNHVNTLKAKAPLSNTSTKELKLENTAKNNGNATRPRLDLAQADEDQERMTLNKDIASENLMNTELVSLMSSDQPEEQSISNNQEKLSLIIQEIDPLNLSIATKTKTVNCPSFKFTKKTKSLSLEIAAGPALSFHELSSTEEHSSYLEARKETEQPLINYGINFKLKKEWVNHFTAAAGFNFSTFNYEYVYVDSNKVNTTTIKIDTFYSGQDLSVSIDTLYEVQYLIEKQKNYNKHQILSFPISLGYKLEVENLFIEPYAGVTFNWHQLVAGDVSSVSDLSPVSYNTHNGDELVYKNKLGLIYHVGLTLGYKVNNKFSVIVQPEFHKVLKSITDSNYPVVEKRDWLNMNIGVKYNIWQKQVIKL